MLKRIRQFYNAITAEIKTEDQKLVSRYLNSTEQQLFRAMDIPTQYHALKVARTCLQLAVKEQGVDENLLIRGALLHDMGKPAGHLTTLLRSIIVAINLLSPRLAAKLSKPGRGCFWHNLRHGFYIQFNHPYLGGQLARQNELDPRVVVLIEKHHRPNDPSESPELAILKHADELN